MQGSRVLVNTPPRITAILAQANTRRQRQQAIADFQQLIYINFC